MVNSPPGTNTISDLGRAFGPPDRLTTRAMLMRDLASLSSLGSRKDRLPIVLHVHPRPAFGSRLVERLVELAYSRIPVIGVFAHGISVVHKAHEAKASAGRGPSPPLLVAIGIAEGEDRLPTDEMVDALGLARTIIDEQHLGRFDQNRARVPHGILGDAWGA